MRTPQQQGRLVFGLLVVVFALACEGTALRLLVLGELRVPAEVDELLVEVEGEGRAVQSSYRLEPAEKLEESLTLLPGEAVQGDIEVRVQGLLEGAPRAGGRAQGRFVDGRVEELTLRLSPLPDAGPQPVDGGAPAPDGGPLDGGPPCLDEDGDGYGDGPGCLGFDCDDDDDEVYEGAPEVCDDKDNDCDLGVDEGCPCNLAEFIICGPVRGECRPGGQACEDGSWGECSSDDVPSAEVCDELDNDCDGQVDEGCVP